MGKDSLLASQKRNVNTNHFSIIYTFDDEIHRTFCPHFCIPNLCIEFIKNKKWKKSYVKNKHSCTDKLTFRSAHHLNFIYLFFYMFWFYIHLIVLFSLKLSFCHLAFNCLLCHSKNDSGRHWDKQEGHGIFFTYN